MASKTSSKFQMVLADYSFANSEAFDSALASWGIPSAGLDYHTVAILGGQSSGKSTLLNLLFATAFDELDASTGIHQTTQGIWIGAATSGSKPVLVLDVEGSDSVERGSEYHTFERRSALFSLALAEVLIVNLWETEVGRQSAVHSSVIRGIMYTFLGQFYHPGAPKTLILFVIRDQYQSKLELLRQKLLMEMKELWSSIDKPEKSQNTTMEDCFEFEFVGLPHMRFQAPAFTEATTALARRFLDEKSIDCVFKSSYCKHNPGDGFSTYAASIWQTVMADKDLDIPSQKRMHAAYRCEKIRAEVTARFNVKVDESNIEALNDFKIISSSLINQFIGEYNNMASRYDEVPYLEHLDALRQHLHSTLGNIFTRLVKRQSFVALNSLRSQFETYQGLNAVACSSFSDLSSIARKTLEQFRTTCENAVPSGLALNFDDIVAELSSSIDLDLIGVRGDQIRLWIQSVTDRIRGSYSVRLETCFDKLELSLWTSTRTQIADIMASIEQEANVKSKDFGASNGDVMAWRSIFQSLLLSIVRDKLDAKIKILPIIMKRRFDQTFRYDERRVPRTWSPNVDLHAIYVDARTRALALLHIFSEPGEDLTVEGQAIFALGADQLEEIRESFDQAISTSYQEALQVQRSMIKEPAPVPSWIYLLLAILGFNEGLSLLSAMLYSPFVLTGVCFLAGLVYLAHGMGKIDEFMDFLTVHFNRGREEIMARLHALQHKPAQ